MKSSRKNLLCILLLASDNVSNKLKQERATNVHQINRSRSEYDEHHTLFSQMMVSFFEYFRMEKEKFKYILNKIEHCKKKWCNFYQRIIIPEERLMVTLR